MNYYVVGTWCCWIQLIYIKVKWQQAHTERAAEWLFKPFNAEYVIELDLERCRVGVWAVANEKQVASPMPHTRSFAGTHTRSPPSPLSSPLNNKKKRIAFKQTNSNKKKTIVPFLKCNMIDPTPGKSLKVAQNNKKKKDDWNKNECAHLHLCRLVSL